jgi:putative ABC transport system permease protein
MSSDEIRRPPRLPERLLRWLLPAGIVGESIVGDMREEYAEFLESDSKIPGPIWYWGRAFLIARRYALKRAPTVNQRPGRPQPRLAERMAQAAGSILRDLHFGLRTLRRRPVFAAISILTLGLGIGGTTAIFSVVDGVLIRDLPFTDPDRIVSVWKAFPEWQGVEGLDYTWDHIQFPWVDYQNVEHNATTLSEVATFMITNRVLTGGGEPERLSVGRASANLFDFLGTRPILGRTFLPEEVPPVGDLEGARVALLSFELWNRRFGADRGVVGRTIRLSGDAYEIVGVLPPGFRIGSDLIRTHENGGAVDPGLRDVWIPLMQYQSNSNSYQLLARLAPGVTVEQARAEIQTLMTDGPEGQLARVQHRKAFVTKGFGTPLLLLFGAAGILLLAACVNVAGLLVGEATFRSHEVTVRYALGAGRGRVVRQLLTENVMLGLMGTVLGLGLAWVGTKALLSVAPPLPRLEEVNLSGQVLLFAVVAGVSTGIMFGLAPALNLAGRSAARAFMPRGQSTRREGRILQAAVVSAQVALTVVLLVAAGLFGRSLLRILAIDPGFNPEGLVSLEVSLPDPESSADERAESEDRWKARLTRGVVATAERVPGVGAVSGADFVPFGGGTFTRSIQLELEGGRLSAAHYHRRVLPGYHELLGIPLKSGRLFTPADGVDDPRVMLVSEGLARQYWPHGSPVGAMARVEGHPVTIVGVVGDVRKTALGATAEPTYYFSAFQFPPRAGFSIVVQAIGDEGSVGRSLREAIRSVDPDLILGTPVSLAALERDSESDDRFRAVLILTFATLATLLAAVGVFGVTARVVAARAREMGIRMALGARGSGLIFLVLRDSILSASAGAIVGLVGALWATNLFEHFLFGVGSLDPVTYLCVIGLLVLVCGCAACIPALRVTKIAPMQVIAQE